MLPDPDAGDASRALLETYAEHQAALSAELRWADFTTSGRYIRGGVSDLNGLSTRIFIDPTGDTRIAALARQAVEQKALPGLLSPGPAGHLHWFVPFRVAGSKALPEQRLRGLSISEDLLRHVVETCNVRDRITPAEHRIVFQVLAGKSPRQAAAEDAVSMETKRAQLKAVSAKLQCGGQTDIVRLVIGQLTQLVTNWSAHTDGTAILERFAQGHLAGDVRVGLERRRDGRSIRYLEAGPPAGRPLLAIHCMLFPMLLRSARPHLEQHNIRLIMPIREGYLDDRPLGDLYRAEDTIAESLADAADLVRRLMDGRAVDVLGHSFGGVMALQFAARHAALTRSVTVLSVNLAKGTHRGAVIGPFLNGLQRASNRPGLFRLIAWQFRKYYASEGAIRRVLRGMFADAKADLQALDRSDAYHWFAESYQHSLVGIAEDFRFVLGDWEQGLGVQQPVTLIHGADDPFTSAPQARQFAELFRHANLVEQKDAGHLLCGSDAKVFWRLVAEHLPPDEVRYARAAGS